MEKRDQINIVLDPATREALNELRRLDPRLPSVSTIVRESIRAAAQNARPAGNGYGDGSAVYPVAMRVV